MGQRQMIHLFSDKPLPRWLFRTDVGTDFIEHRTKLFGDECHETWLSHIVFGSWDWKISVASLEMSLMEMMAGLPRKVSFHGVDVIMESVLTLRPDVVDDLLRCCRSVKVKRLFLWFAAKHQHPWFEALKLDDVDLGSGKRVVEKAGRLDRKYLITVPKDTDDQQRQSIF